MCQLREWFVADGSPTQRHVEINVIVTESIGPSQSVREGLLGPLGFALGCTICLIWRGYK